MRSLGVAIFFTLLFFRSFAQHSNETTDANRLQNYEDSLVMLGKTFVNDTDETVRKNANYSFIKTLVSALKVPNSFLYPFDSVKMVSIINSPDNRFRIFSWPIQNNDGSYRFYGTIQINTGGALLMYPLNDYSAFIKNPEDTITDTRHWYGAEYYRIVPVYSPHLYYVLLGWKGNDIHTTKKVIEVLTFKDSKPGFGYPAFEGNGKMRKRVVFQYTRQASMLLRYVPDDDLIVFDHLSPPDAKQKNQFDTYGPDLSYDGYRLKNGQWVYVDNLDMRNIPRGEDNNYVDPKKQAAEDRAKAAASQANQ
jgi:hypothetical protein